MPSKKLPDNFANTIIDAPIKTIPPGAVEDDDIEEMCEYLLRDDVSDASFQEFVDSVYSFWEKNHYVTQGQYNAIESAYLRALSR